MMGFGSSNLSPLAPPFTVDRSIPKPSAAPLVDLGEPLNWIDTNPYNFDSPQRIQHLDPIPTSSYDQSSDLFEPKPYFSSYVSPPFRVPNFDDQSLSGLDHTAQWGVGSWDWEKSNPAQLGGSFYSQETDIGIHPSKGLNTCEETSHNFYSRGMDKQLGAPSIDNLDFNPVPGQILSYAPVGYSKTSVIGSSSALPEDDLQVNGKNNQVPFNIPYENEVRQHDMSGHSPSNVNEPHYSLNFGSKNEFDPSQLSYHLDGNRYSYGDSPATRTEKLSTSNMVSKDASDHMFRAKSGVTFSHISPDNFSLALDNDGVIDVENAVENLDNYSPPLDSPCWRGAPSSHNSPIGSSEAVSVQLPKKLEACDDAKSVSLPSRKQGEIRINVENGNVDDGSASCMKLPSVFYNRETRSACKINFSDDASEWKKNYVLFDESVDEVEKTPCTIGQSLAERRLASKKLLAVETGVSDLDTKINDVSGCGSAHISCHDVKNSSCSPSSMKDVSTKNSKFFGEEPVSNNIGVLLDTMHNLSKLLLDHCSNETCKLKEQDLESLEKVMNNLDTCMPKKVGQDSFFSELHGGNSTGRPRVAATDVWSRHVQEKTKHSRKKDEKRSDFVSVKSGADIKAKNDKMTQAIKKVLVEYFDEKEEANPQALLYKNLWLEAEAALCSVNYMARFNKMKIEMEKCKSDSEKDLPEAASDEDKISSPKFSAEVNTDKKSTALAESAPPVAVTNQNSPVESFFYHDDNDDVDKYSSYVHKGDVDEYSSSKIFSDSDGVDKSETEVKDNSTLGLSFEDSPVQGTACRTDDVEASIMSRFHILKHRDSDEMESKIMPEVADLEFAGMTKQTPLRSDMSEDGMSGFKLGSVSQQYCTVQSPGSTGLGNQVSAGRYEYDNSALGLLSDDSPVQGTACETDDVEASIISRFHILKHRDSDEMESKLMPEVADLGFARMAKQMPLGSDTSEDGMSGFKLGSVSRHYCTVQSPGSTGHGNQVSAGRYDNSTLCLSAEDSLVQGTACETNDVEASIMSRFHTLKHRDSDEMESKLLPEVADLGFSGMTKQIPLGNETSEDGMSGFKLGSVLQQCCTMQSPGSIGLGNQVSAGRYGSCSSDWEHVLKEEFSGQNS